MQPIPASCAYSPRGTKKVLLFFLPLLIEPQVINILIGRVQSVSELYCFPDECVISTSAIDIPVPPVDLKIVMAVISGSASAEEAAGEAQAQVAWANINLLLEEMEAPWAIQCAQLIQIAKRITNIN